MIGAITGLKWAGKFFGFFNTREGRILLLVLAAVAFVQYQRIDAGREATAEVTAAVEAAKAEAEAEWQGVVAQANEDATAAALVAATEIAELKLIVQEIENDPESDSCRISGELLERLRAIQ